MTPDLVEDWFVTERVTFIGKRGTIQTVAGYVITYPGVWNNSSHFIRSAIESYVKEQRKKGRHIETR